MNIREPIQEEEDNCIDFFYCEHGIPLNQTCKRVLSRVVQRRERTNGTGIMFVAAIGTIFKCSNGKFVRIQKTGQVEQPNGRLLDGYLGHEVDDKGKNVRGWLHWDLKGNNPRSREWDLRESCQGTDPQVAREAGWPASD